MNEYYVVNNKEQETGEHEVHKEGCRFFPKDNKYLGFFSNCHQAVAKAKEIYSNVDGCYYCCNPCHTK